MKLNKYIVGFMASTLMMLASSCRDDTFSEYRDENNSDEFTVTINVGLEGMEYSTRKGEGKTDDISKKHYIGEGSQVDMLVYAVYFDANKSNGSTTTNSDPDWEAAPEYTKGVVDPENKFEDLKVTPGYGQTILYVGNTLPKNEKQQITLTLKKGQQYKVVFWAQNHKTEAFVIDDLKRVQMKYKVVHSEEGKPEEIKSLNNDEQRDAFCRSVDISGDQSNRDITIYLRRPLAQINVGTTGYDFETITRNADKKYLYSKIRINRAARYLNVVEDYVYTNTIGDDPSITEDKEAFYTIDYEYAKIPAYWDMEIPKYPSYTAYDLNEGGAFDIFKHNHGALLDQSNEKNSFLSIYGQEEFLRVHLNKPKEGSDENSNDNEEDTEEDTEEPPVFRDEYDDGYLPYASMGASGDDDNNVQTEIFKYLSMCYILTPTNGSHTLTNVKMWVATDEEGSDEVEVLNLNNVPVKANHRTNMVGSLLTAKADMQIIVDEDFAGRKIHGNNDLQSGEIVEGFYYDAEKNEFQISSVNGLLFFQQLVNGDLTVRQVYNTGQGVAVGDPYPYYSPDDPDDKTTYSLKYKSWKRSDLKNEDIANIIIKGSGYDQLAVSSGKSEKCANKNWTIKVQYNGSKGNNNLWPEYNNFPFYGATVKLMADIDLAGIEWIPIGFDCANWDNTFGSYNKGYNGYYNSTKDNLIINYIALTNPDKTKTEIDLGRRRAFCGTFDGNGHTIYNLRTKRFGAAVHESAFQEYETSNMGGPYDNVQWFEKGFFGVCGPGVVIKDLRLQNVDIQGNNGAAAVVAQVSSLGFPAKIINCVVDGGTIDAVPLYRGDYRSSNFYRRTAARGCYIGGIVGQFCAKDDTGSYTEDDIKNGIKNKGNSEITGCEVRNIVIQGYRRIGGIVGAIAEQGSNRMGIADIQLDIDIYNNKVSNTTLIVNQYRPFDSFWDHMNDANTVWQNGFAWGSGVSKTPMSNYIVGGYYHTDEEKELVLGSSSANDYDAFKYDNYTKKSITDRELYYNDIEKRNTYSNVQYTELAVTPDGENSTSTSKNATKRLSTIQNIPLKYIPMLTSLFTDDIKLKNNYYGETRVYSKVEFGDRIIWYGQKQGTKDLTFSLPLNFPNGCDITYNEKSPKVGMYVESVEINGYEAPNNRSVITPTGIEKDGSCVMYITARDRKQFAMLDNVRTNLTGGADMASKDKVEAHYKQPTIVRNVVLRGSPYAWAGILLAPNENMSEVILDNVTIYDVYQTLALQQEGSELQNYTNWTNANAVKLEVKDCNLRGYTVPGAGWGQISYNKTTFEPGSETKLSSSGNSSTQLHKLYYEDSQGNDMTFNDVTKKYSIADMQGFKTCRVDANTTFTGCFFKAPFFIDLSHKNSNVTVNFDNCEATSAYKNVKIDGKYIKDNNVAFVEITSDTKAGKTVVRYYAVDGNSSEANRPGYMLKEDKSQ